MRFLKPCGFWVVRCSNAATTSSSSTSTFGNLAHQLQTRLYFDLIRNEGEYNFLRFLPSAERDKLRRAWYAEGGEKKLFTTYAAPDDAVPTRIVYNSRDPKAEFVTRLHAHMSKVVGPPDLINRCEQADCRATSETRAMQQTHHALRRFAARSAAVLPVIKFLPELEYLRVTITEGERLMYSLVHNRAHSNVAFMTGEEERLEPEKDTLTIWPDPLGSYPNFIFNVPLAEVDVFADALAAVAADAA